MSKTQEQTTEVTILDAAKRVFLRKGYAAARMQEVADEADINKAMLHYYFRSKEKLFNVILAEAVGRVAPIINRTLTEPGLSVLEKLELISERHMQVIFQEPHLPLFLIHELSQRRDTIAKEIGEQVDQSALLAFFQQVTEEGLAGKIKQVDPVHLILNAISLTVFPFVIGPIVQAMSGASPENYEAILKDRKEEVRKALRAMLQP